MTHLFITKPTIYIKLHYYFYLISKIPALSVIFFKIFVYL